jgi:rare lipoprotein A
VPAVALMLLIAGCGQPHTKASYLKQEEAPPPIQAQSYPSAPLPSIPLAPTPGVKPPAGRIATTPAPAGGVSSEDIEFVRTHQPLLSEEGLATWYTAARGRKAANGELFSDQALTAAHRTLPMGTLIVVTNIESGQSSPMRITDRGPFVEDKLIDLTIASAKATGVYRAGTARVRIDVYRAPKPIHSGGRWCVQIGAFKSERKANKLKTQLQSKYPSASVIEFPGEESYWVRIRPKGDNREAAEGIARRLRPTEGAAFLTRLD